MSIKNFCIWGMPGAGKTSLISSLKFLNIPLYDTDAIIEKICGSQIPLLPSIQHFHLAERNVIHWAIKIPYAHGLITGGSTPLRLTKELLMSYQCIWFAPSLQDSFEGFIKRPRIGLGEVKSFEDYQALFEQRCKFYNQAHYKVESHAALIELIKNLKK